MRVLVTGGLGYLGRVLVPLLREKGHQVITIDLDIFGPTDTTGNIYMDIGDATVASMPDVDAVIHLAGLSNDPMADFAPSENWRVNAVGTYRVAQAAAQRGVPRFLYASSCSVYGHRRPDEPLAEEHMGLRGCTNYAGSKFMGEVAVKEFFPRNHLIFRMATICGPSPRMRWDLALHPMVKSGIQQGVVRVFDPTSQRPLIDVRDVAQAYSNELESGLTGTHNLATLNANIAPIGQFVQQALQDQGHPCVLERGHETDLRSYRVCSRWLGTGISIEQTIADVIAAAIPESLADPRTVNIDFYRAWLAQKAQLGGNATGPATRIAAAMSNREVNLTMGTTP